MLSISDTLQKRSSRQIISSAVPRLFYKLLILIISRWRIQCLRPLSFWSIPFVISEHYASVHTAQILYLPLRAENSVRVMMGAVGCVSRYTKYRSVVVLRGNARCSITYVRRARYLRGTRRVHCKCRHPLRCRARNTHYRSERMGYIVGSGQMEPPMVRMV